MILRSKVLQPTLVDLRRYLRRFDLRPSSPKHIGVSHWNPAGLEMRVDRRLMIEQPLFFSSVRNRHDIYVTEFGAGLAPVTMSEDLMSAHL